MGLDSDDTARRNRNRSWWQQRTRMERGGIVLFAIALVLIIALIVALAIVAHKPRIRPEDEICSTPSCVQSAARLLKNMDQSVDPCDNFYEFVCGSFVRETVIPDDQLTVGAIQDLTNLLQQQLRTIFEEPSSPNEIRPFVLLKTYYGACLDTDLEDSTVISEIIQELGGWPALDRSWSGHSFDWKRSVYKSRKMGLSLSNFIKVDVKPDMENSSQYIIYLDQAELDVSKELFLDGLENQLIKEYSNYLVDLAVIFGAEQVFAEYEVKNMLEFKMQLSNISLTAAERRDESLIYHPMTIRELQQRYPTIYWLDFLSKVLDLPYVSVTNEQKISVNVPEYLSKIGYLLDRTDKRVLANHVLFEVVRSLEMYLPKAVRDREQQFQVVASGRASRPPRWQECVLKTSTALPIATGALYARKYFKEETKQAATEMISDIKDAFLKILEKTQWMDEATKSKAIEKALVMNAHVGYPDEFLDDKKLEEYYSKLNFSTDHMIHIAANVSMFQKNKDYEKLGKPVNKTDWRTRYPTADINAVCEPVENSITLPAAILQSTIFDKNRLHSLNYGNMGFFIGHEITHGYDDQGRKYDKDGNLIDWWAKETGEAFLQKAKCIINQYANYSLAEISQNVNGELTQGENIADNGGVKEAYMAYNDWVERNGPEPKLPGLKYNAKQLFWISAASTWCSKDKNVYMQYVLLDSHSPNRFRVLGSFSNLDSFASDFNCPVGSKMNPKHKCQVW